MNEARNIVKDDDGVDYVVEDIQAFHQHLLDFHASGPSLHTENGHRFTVTDELRRQVAELAGAQDG